MALINKIKLSEIENFKDLSPEFYKAEYMKKSADIRKNKFRRLSQISYITDGEHGSPCWSDSSGIKYVTAEFIKENFIEQGITKQITFEQDRRNARARLKEGDILIYSVGAYAGLTCVAEPHLFPANIPRSVAIVRLNNNDEFYPEFISVFLNSNIGQFQSVRFRAGNSQPVLALEKIRQFEVPIFDNKIQSDI
jgi:restriction endonuclease S subunit